jgi:hypothetical protein
MEASEKMARQGHAWPPSGEYKMTVVIVEVLCGRHGSPSNSRALGLIVLYFDHCCPHSSTDLTTWPFLCSGYVNGSKREWQIRLHFWERRKRVYWAPDQPPGYVGML